MKNVSPAKARTGFGDRCGPSHVPVSFAGRQKSHQKCHVAVQVTQYTPVLCE